MFLNQLNRQEKELFLKLAYQIANCDQNFSEKERELIMSYRKEMGLSESEEFTKKYWESEHIILNCFDMLEKAVTEEDVNLFAKGINDLAFSFEKVLQFKNFEEFDEFMQTNQMLTL